MVEMKIAMRLFEFSLQSRRRRRYAHENGLESQHFASFDCFPPLVGESGDEECNNATIF